MKERHLPEKMVSLKDELAIRWELWKMKMRGETFDFMPFSATRFILKAKQEKKEEERE